LIDSTAKMLAGQFFNRFEEIVVASVATANDAPPAPETISTASGPASSPGLSPGSVAWIILAVLGIALIAFYLLG
ncbi:MAG: hypothetical protein AB7G35_17580, partial [Hyphomicrobiaceae bacterium]